jgi:Fe-S-cluster formation regulator IscX/YfhJ
MTSTKELTQLEQSEIAQATKKHLTNIKISKQQDIIIHYYTVDKSNTKYKTEVEAVDPPLVKFTETLRALKSYIPDLCEFEDDNEIIVIGLSLKYDNCDALKGLTISALRTLHNFTSPMCINTPYLEVDGDNFPGQLYNEVEDIINLAKGYLNGDRAIVQQKLAI